MKSLIVLILALLILMPADLSACSVVTVVKDGKVFLAGNADTSYDRVMKLRVIPEGDGLFGRVCISMETVPGWTPAGMKCMNDQGLAISHAVVPSGKTPFDPDKPQFRHNFLEKIASECATVKQAIAMVQAYTLPPQHGAFIHLMMADRSGDAAVIEWLENEVKVIRRDGPTMFMTNSFLSKPSTEGPKSRFTRGSRMLGQLQPVPESIIPLLKEISVGAVLKGQEVGTLNSTIWDITGRKLYIYYKRDFDHPLVFDIDAELAKGAKTVDLPVLFPHPVPFETAWRDDNGPVVRKQAN